MFLYILLMKKKVTLSVDGRVYSDFQKFCEKNAFVVSKKIELMIKEVLENRNKK